MKTTIHLLWSLIASFSLVVPGASASWMSVAPVPATISDHFAQTVGGIIYSGAGCIGGPACGGGLFAYDPGTDTWSTRSGLGSFYQRATAAVDGKVYAFGGIAGGGPLSTSHVYDPVTDTWSGLPGMPTPRTTPTAAAVNGKIYVFGGSPSFGPNPGTTANEVFDPVTNSWTSLAPMPRVRVVGSAVAIGGLIYLLGGEDGVGSFVTTTWDIVDVYDPMTNTWSTLSTPMPTARKAAGAVAFNDKILIAGGSLQGTVLDSFEAYDPAQDFWTSLDPMPIPRQDFPLAIAGNRVYAVGGNSVGFVTSAVDVFDASQLIAVPAPPSLSLFLTGLGAFAFVGWRIRRTNRAAKQSH